MTASRTSHHAAYRTLAALALAAPLAALAHTGADGGAHHGFLAGALHPFTGVDHLAAMVAVGLWSALTARSAWPGLLWAPTGFAAMLLAGAMAGLAGAALPGTEPMIAASLLVIGLLVVTRLELPGLVAAGLVGVFALFHGIAHGHELASQGDAAATLAGMLCSTVLLHLLGIAGGWTLRRRSHWLPRLAGSGVALFGAVLLAQMA